ncbi:MAG TPA: glycosyltransferase [Tepidisphaeraceae bacterium]|nr:glycosyltransferase [Tepidisphaeraceae bacterium]
MISVIICSIDPAKFAAVETMYGAALAGEKWELIGIHDAASMAEGYSRAIDRSRGDVLVFSHDDVEVLSPRFAKTVRGHLGSYDLFGVAGTTLMTNGFWTEAGPPYGYGQIVQPAGEGKFQVFIYSNACRIVGGIQGVDGVFMAARRSVFSRVRFDAETFDGFHLYDQDLCFSVWRSGLKTAVACDVCLLHQSPGTYDATLNKYASRFVQKWLRGQAAPPVRPYTWTTVTVGSKAEALEIMRPPHWAT